MTTTDKDQVTETKPKALKKPLVDGEAKPKAERKPRVKKEKVVKEKKPRSEKQIAALAKARNVLLQKKNEKAKAIAVN